VPADVEALLLTELERVRRHRAHERALAQAPGACARIPGHWNNANHAPAKRELRAAARKLGQEVIALNVSAEADFEPAFATLNERRANAEKK
jgi:hypothetical protein